MQNNLPELSDTTIGEEYYSFDANMYTCSIYKKDPDVIGFRNIKLTFQTRIKLDIDNLDLTLTMNDRLFHIEFEFDSLIFNMMPLKKYTNKSRINDAWYHEIPILFNGIFNNNCLQINNIQLDFLEIKLKWRYARSVLHWILLNPSAIS
jgi:hypothetical protein